jgi:hypothetical protein
MGCSDVLLIEIAVVRMIERSSSSRTDGNVTMGGITEAPSRGEGMLKNVSTNQAVTHIIAITVIFVVMWMLLQGQTIPDLLVGLCGMVVAHYFRRQTEDDVHAQSERVLGTQVVVDDRTRAAG